MDKLDWKILQVLDWNGRMPANKIAKAVRSNKDVVAYRMKKLDERGIIVRYFPILNMNKLGFHTSRLCFELEELKPEREQAFLKFLDEDIRAGLIFRMDYPYRYGIFLWTRSLYDIQTVLVKIKQFLGNSLTKYDYSLICTFRQYPKDYLFGKKHHDLQTSLEPTEKISYDENDFRILGELANDARATTTEIAKRLNIPQTTVSAKIKTLEKKKILQGYRAEINFIKLGFVNYFLEIYLSENQELKKIEHWADAHKNVVWLQKIVGTCDIEVEVEVKDRTELESLLNELREKFPAIRKILFFSQEYKKLTFLPTT